MPREICKTALLKVFDPRVIVRRNKPMALVHRVCLFGGRTTKEGVSDSVKWLDCHHLITNAAVVA